LRLGRWVALIVAMLPWISTTSSAYTSKSGCEEYEGAGNCCETLAPAPDAGWHRCRRDEVNALLIQSPDHPYVVVDTMMPDTVVDDFTIEFWALPSLTLPTVAQANSGFDGSSQKPLATGAAHGSQVWGAGHAGAGVAVGTNGVTVWERGDAYLAPILHWAADTNLTDWAHIAVVYSASQPRLYVNGLLKKTGLTSTRIVHPGLFGEAGIGSTNGVGSYVGALDEIRVWSASRTQAELQSALGRELTAPERSSLALVRYYRMNEGRGGRTYDVSPAQQSAQFFGGKSSEMWRPGADLEFEVPNTPPAVPQTPIPTVVGKLGTLVTVASPATRDADGDGLHWTVVGLPSGATVDTTSGLISWVPTTSDVGTHSGITFRAGDGTDAMAAPSFNITIRGPAPAAPAMGPGLLALMAVSSMLVGGRILGRGKSGRHGRETGPK